MNREEKQREVETLHAMFAQARSAYLLDFRGLTVVQASALRRQVRAAHSSYRVVKNTLAVRAAEETPLAPLREIFTGPTAVAIAERDPAALAKVLRDFAKESSLTFKGGIVEGKAVTAAEIAALADLPSREALLQKLASLLRHPLTSLAGVLQAPLLKAGLALRALESKKNRPNP